MTIVSLRNICTKLPDCHRPGSHAYLPRSWPSRWSLKTQQWLWRWHPRTRGGRGWCPDWLEVVAWKTKLTLTRVLWPLGNKHAMEGASFRGALFTKEVINAWILVCSRLAKRRALLDTQRFFPGPSPRPPAFYLNGLSAEIRCRFL